MSLIQSLEKWNRTLAICVAFGLMACIGALDYVTGYELSFFLFYFVPVSLLAWKGGRWLGIVGAAISAVVWAEANIAAGQIFSSPFVMYWNGGARFLAFVLVTYLLSVVKDSIAHLEGLSRTDSLTGASNARAFLEQLKGETERARRYRRPFTLSYIDLDNFKAINDSFGHATGDTVLQTVVSEIRTHVRATDVIARLGGDEFALLLPETDRDAAQTAISKIRRGIVREMASRGWPVTVSIGSLTCFDSRLGVDELIKKADDLMYESKSKGKDTASFSSLP